MVKILLETLKIDNSCHFCEADSNNLIHRSDQMNLWGMLNLLKNIKILKVILYNCTNENQENRYFDICGNIFVCLFIKI